MAGSRLLKCLALTIISGSLVYLSARNYSKSDLSCNPQEQGPTLKRDTELIYAEATETPASTYSDMEARIRALEENDKKRAKRVEELENNYQQLSQQINNVSKNLDDKMRRLEQSIHQRISQYK